MFDFVINFFTADNPSEPQQILGPLSIDSKPSTAESDDEDLQAKSAPAGSGQHRRSLLAISSTLVSGLGSYSDSPIVQDSAAFTYVRQLQDAAAEQGAQWGRQLFDMWNGKPKKRKKQKNTKLERITDIIERNVFFQQQAALPLAAVGERVLKVTNGMSLSRTHYMGDQCEEEWRSARLQRYLAWLETQQAGSTC